MGKVQVLLFFRFQQPMASAAESGRSVVRRVALPTRARRGLVIDFCMVVSSALQTLVAAKRFFSITFKCTAFPDACLLFLWLQILYEQQLGRSLTEEQISRSSSCTDQTHHRKSLPRQQRLKRAEHCDVTQHRGCSQPGTCRVTSNKFTVAIVPLPHPDVGGRPVLESR